MSKEINLTSSEWTDIVFEGRNKEYGAYQMRQSASKRHIYALLIVTTMLVFVTYLPSLIKAVVPEKFGEGGYVDPTELTQINSDVKEQPKPIPLEEPPVKVKPTITFTPPEITTEKITDAEKMKAQTELSESRAVISTTTQAGSLDRDAVDPSELSENHAVTQTEKPEVFLTVEQMPQFPGGEKELMAYLAKNIKYPTVAAENNIQGRVTLKFVVSKTGAVTDIQIIKGFDPSCDKEALRVVKAMPKWIPGKQNGQNVNVYYTLPVTYRLQN